MKRSLFAAAALWAAFSFGAHAQSSSHANFMPDFGTGVSIAATTASASATLTGNALNDSELYLWNAGTGTAYCRWGVGAQTATVADLPIPTGSAQIFARGLTGANTIACITATGTATISIVAGNGGYH